MPRILSLLFVFLYLTSTSQESFSGKIVEEDGITPIAYATVFIDQTSIGDISDANGEFVLKNIVENEILLVVSIIGYQTFQKKINLEEFNTPLLIPLKNAVNALDLITISSTSLTGGNLGIGEIPGSAYYVSPKQIEKFSYTDINRTLRAVPGINIQEEDGFGLRPNIGLRGTGVERSSKISVMEDGVLMAPAPYAAPAAYYFPTIGRMQAIEILKGSSQIKYGPYTTGGAINLISTSIPDHFSGRVHLIGGSYGARNVHANVGNMHQNIGYMVETFQYESDGFKNLENGSETGFDKQDYLFKFRIQTNPDAKVFQSLGLKLGIADESSNETYLGLTSEDFLSDPYQRYAGSQNDLMKTQQEQYSLTHQVQLPFNLDISTTAYRTDFHRNWYKLDKVKDSTGKKLSIASLLEDPGQSIEALNIIKGQTSPHTDALYVKANNRTYYAQGLQSIFSYRFNSEKIHHQLLLGLRYHIDEIDRFQWVDVYSMRDGIMQLRDVGQPGTESNRIEKAKAFAAYLQYKFKFQNLTLTPGLRFEDINVSRLDFGKNDPNRLGAELNERENHVNVFIPGIGLDYKFNTNVSAFLGIHKGFAPPGSKEETKPEESINYEIGTRFNGKGFSGQAIFFLNDYDNLLGSDLAAAGGSGSNQLFNGGAVTAKGIEFQLSYDLLNNSELRYSIPVSLIYSWTDAFFKSDFDSEFDGWGEVENGDELPYLANHQMTFLLGFEHSKLNLNVSGRYTGAMRTTAGQGKINDDQKTDSHFTLDASIDYSVQRNLHFFANATNLLDNVYIVARRPAGLRPGMPRAFNIGIKAQF